MNRYIDEGITLLQHFKTKDNTEEMKKDLYEINNILYKHIYRYTLPRTSYRLFIQLRDYGVKIKEYHFNKPQLKDKQKEILDKLHDVCIKLKALANVSNPTNSEYSYAANQIQKYAVTNYLKQRDIISNEDILMLLRDNKDIYSDINDVNLITKPFRDMQKELLLRLNKEYEF